MQQIGEGALLIPEQWHNSTVNIFTSSPPGSRGVSLTINRDRLPLGMPIQDYAAEQFGKIRNKLRDFRMVDNAPVTVDERQGQLCEFTWHSEDQGDLHQFLLCVADRERLINFAVSYVGLMSDATRLEMRSLLLSFRFNQAPLKDSSHV